MKRIGLLLFILVNLHLCMGNNLDLPFYKFSPDEGLIPGRMDAIGQDGDGYIWMYGGSRILRFDGYNTKYYDFCFKSGKRLHKRSFPTVKYFVKNYNQQIIAVTRGGAFKYSKKLDGFINWNLNHSDGSDVAKIRGISQLSKGKLYVVADDIFGEIDSAGIVIPYVRLDGLQKNNYQLCVNSNANVALVYNRFDKLVYQIDLINHEIEKKKVFKNIPFDDLIYDNNNNIWRFWRGHIEAYNAKGESVYEQILFNKSLNVKASRHNGMAIDAQGQYWIATNRGLFVLNPYDKKLQAISYNPYIQNGLFNNLVTSIYIDEEAGVWCGTQNGGLGYTSMDLNRISHFKILNNRQGIQFVVNAFEEDEIGNIYVATIHNGIWILDQNTKKMNKLTVKKADVVMDNFNILCLKIINDKLWIGTARAGLYVYDRYKEKIERVEEWGARQVNSIVQVNEDELIVAGYKRIVRLNLSSHKMDNLVCWNESDQKITTNILYLKRSEKGAVFAGSSGSYMFVYDDGKKGFVPINKKYAALKKLSNSLDIEKIVEDDKSNIWAVTKFGGILRIDANFKDFEWLQTAGRNNLEIIKSFEVDQFGNLWITSLNGLYYMNIENDRMIRYTKVDGLQSNVFQLAASIRTKENRIFLGGINGFNVLHPLKSHLPLSEKKIRFTGLFINNKEVLPTDNSLLDRDLNDKSVIKLSYSQRNFDLVFNSFDYNHAGNVQYRYKLEGYDRDWVHLKSETNMARYNEVPPGNYNFTACASIDDEWIEEESRQIRIVVKPPWWRSNIAIALYLCLFFILTLSVYRVIRFRVELYARLREEKIKQHSKDELTKAKLKFFTNISHEIRTPLSLIAGPIDQLNTSGELGVKDQALVHLAQNNIQRLLKMVNQLLEFRRFEAEDFPLHVSPLNLQNFMEKKFGFFSTKANSEGKYFEYSVDKDIDLVWVDEEKVETIIYNLLSNAFKYTSNGDRVELRLVYADTEKKDHLHILVEDTGQGMSNSQLTNIFQRFFQGKNNEYLDQRGSGIGLSIVDDYVKLHGGTIDVSSEEGKGTLFQISLPILREAYLDQKSSVFIDEEVAGEDRVAEMEKGLFYTQNGQSPKEHSRSGASSILVIEDNDEMRKFIKSCLLGDYEVHEAENGKVGVEIAQEIVPDLIISDVKMPVMNGIQLCAAIKNESKTSHIPVVLLTAKTTIDDQVEGIESGADLYLMKPFHSTVLNANIKQLIEQRQKLANKFRSEVCTDLAIEDSLSKVDQKLLKEITAIIEKELTNPELNVQLLCDQVGFNHQQLYRKLKAISGQSVNEFIRTVRLKHAAHMLKLTRLNITEIMYETGFSNRSYFTKSFRMQYEVSPREYRSNEKYLCE